MKFSIIVPTLNNLDYLKILINSINKNSVNQHEIIIHVNENLDGTKNFLEQNKILYKLLWSLTSNCKLFSK